MLKEMNILACCLLALSPCLVLGDDVVHGQFNGQPHEKESHGFIESGDRTNGDLDPNHSEVREFEPGFDVEKRFDEETTSTSTTTSYPKKEHVKHVEIIESPGHETQVIINEHGRGEHKEKYEGLSTHGPHTTKRGFLEKVIDYFTSTSKPHHHEYNQLTTKAACCGDNCTGPCGAHRACVAQCSKYSIQNNNYQGDFKMVLHIHDNATDGCNNGLH